MGGEAGTWGAGFCEDHGEDGGFVLLEVEFEVEAVGEEGLHHEAVLVFGGVGRGGGFDEEAVGFYPGGEFGEHRVFFGGGEPGFVGEGDVGEEFEIGVEAALGVAEPVVGAEGEGGWGEVAFVLADGGYIEAEGRAGGFLPGGFGRLGGGGGEAEEE